MNMNMEKKNKKGFTLIELLVVVAIMGLLAGVAIVALNSARQKARDARRVADVKQIQTALELYYNDNNGYPTSNVAALGGRCLGSNGFVASGACTGTTYMGIVPFNPSPETDGSCPDIDYSYFVEATTGTTYAIRWCIGAATGSIGVGLHWATPNGMASP